MIAQRAEILMNGFGPWTDFVAAITLAFHSHLYLSLPLCASVARSCDREVFFSGCLPLLK